MDRLLAISGIVGALALAQSFGLHILAMEVSPRAKRPLIGLMDATKKGQWKWSRNQKTTSQLWLHCSRPSSALNNGTHRPLKIGIGNDLVARGVLGQREVNAALKRYIDRLMYQKCLAAGGARIDLEGNAAGEVSSAHRCRAERLVARVEARQLTESAGAKAEAESERAVRQAPMTPSVLNGEPVCHAAACPNDAAPG
jgi:sRNA-binding protein